MKRLQIALALMITALAAACDLPPGYLPVEISFDEDPAPAGSPVPGLPTGPVFEQMAETATETAGAAGRTTPAETPVLPSSSRDPAAESAVAEAAEPGETGFIPAYVPQVGTPFGLPNFSHPDLACNWMGVGGQIFGSDGWPVAFLVVEIGGELGEQPVSQLALTGTAQQWGPGGYEFVLGDRPIASRRTLWLQVHDLEGRVLSGRLYFDTYDECNRNAIMINLAPAPKGMAVRAYLPLIFYNVP